MAESHAHCGRLEGCEHSTARWPCESEGATTGRYPWRGEQVVPTYPDFFFSPLPLGTKTSGPPEAVTYPGSRPGPDEEHQQRDNQRNRER